MTNEYYGSYEQLDDGVDFYEKWDQENKQVLRDIFDALATLREYSEHGGRIALDPDDRLVIK